MKLQVIQDKIYEIRGHRIMLDVDLAELYEVETRVLKQAVKRNIDRFPADFMFQINRDELKNLTSQFVISSSSWGGTRYLPFAFTEQGVAMLSGVLKSKKAVQVNVAIMRAFVFVRNYALSHKDLTAKLKEMESRYDKQFEDVYEAINYLMQKDQQEKEHKERKRIGFKTNND